MDIEFEAKFPDINKDEVRKALKKIGAELVKPEFLQRRVVFFLPKGNEVDGGWLRVRDEADKITMSLKAVSGNKIHDQKEVQLVIDNFEKARQLLTGIGCIEKAFQESKRELWILNGVEITIDEWPFLEPYIEIEGPSEKDVKKVSEILGFNWKNAVFGALDILINKKYDIPFKVINDETPLIVFGGENPWTTWLRKNKKR